MGSMYSVAKIKGKIDDMRQKAGIFVMAEILGHVGLYVGDCNVIECTLNQNALFAFLGFRSSCLS